MRGVVLTPTEFEALLVSSTGANEFMDCSFGPGRISLLMVPHNAWAIDRLYEMRFGSRKREVYEAVQAVEKTGIVLGVEKVPNG